MNRPVETLSGTQQIALLATGAIWTRWCLIIKPKNILLASVNFFLGAVAGVQVYRIFNYQTSLGNSVPQALKNIAFPSDKKETPSSKPQGTVAAAIAEADAAKQEK